MVCTIVTAQKDNIILPDKNELFANKLEETKTFLFELEIGGGSIWLKIGK
jgi:hypothetical protein